MGFGNEQCDVARHTGQVNPRCEGSFVFGAWFFVWSVGSFGSTLFVAGGLAGAGGVEGELSEEFSGRGVNYSNVELVDEEEDGGSGVGSSYTDFVEVAVVAEGDFAGVVDTIAA